MKNKYLFFILALCPLLPTSANFAYSLIISCGLLFFFTVQVSSRIAIKALELEELYHSILVFLITCSAIVYYRIIFIFFPIIAHSIDLYIYISAFAFLFIFNSKHESLSFLDLLYFILFYLLFTFIREFIGFGSISIPSLLGIKQIILKENSLTTFYFIATTSGGLLFLAFLSWLFIFLEQKNSLPKDV